LSIPCCNAAILRESDRAGSAGVIDKERAQPHNPRPYQVPAVAKAAG